MRSAERGFVLLGAILFALVNARAEGLALFEKHMVDASFQNGYQVSIADMDGDGKLDILALSTDPPQLVWYRMPECQRFSITSHGKAYIDMAPYDISGDGHPDLALASEFNLQDSRHGGAIQWLECPPDPMRQQEWALHPIDAMPTSHRVRWATLDPGARPVLLVLPLLGIGAEAPEYAVAAQFKAYTIPPDPSKDAWAAHVIDDSRHMAHGLLVTRWANDPYDSVLTASFEGVHLFRKEPGASAFTRTQIGVGHQEPRPKQGSSEVGYGHLTAANAPFIPTIEPWHGNEVVVYTNSTPTETPWPRTVIDASFDSGHALACADLDGDGNDEIIAGFRGKDASLYIYRYNGVERQWQRTALDEGGIAAAGLAIADMNNDGWPDIIATGTSTANVVWYENCLARQRG